MKQEHIHQELLIFTNTSLAHNVFCETPNSEGDSNDSLAEKLEQACWNGLLKELFPEIIVSGAKSFPKIFIWKIGTRKSYLFVDLGDIPSATDFAHSVDPQLFLPDMNLN